MFSRLAFTGAVFCFAGTIFCQTPFLLKDIHQPVPHLLMDAKFPLFGGNGRSYLEAYSTLYENGLWVFEGQQPATLIEQAPYSVEQGFATDNGAFLLTYSAEYVRNLWKSDGTAGSARLLDTVKISTGSPYEVPAAVFQNQLYYNNFQAGAGWELHRSDGTAAGSQLFSDCRPGPGSGHALNFAVGDSLLFFTAQDQANKTQLWRTDGTTAGTFALTSDANPVNGYLFYSGEVVQNTLFFLLIASGNAELWKSDGTVNGTGKVKTIGPSGGALFSSTCTTVNDKYLFPIDDGINGSEWWTSDGTEAGTQLLKDITPGSESSYFYYAKYAPSTLGGLFFFFEGEALWRTDGTPQSTVKITELPHPLLAALGATDELYYFLLQTETDSIELWRTDGLLIGTQFVKNLGTTDFPYYSGWPAAVAGDALCFLFRQPDPEDPLGAQQVLLRTDGTLNGTYQVDGAPAAVYEVSNPSHFAAAADGTVFFQAWSEENFQHVWKTTDDNPLSAIPADTAANEQNNIKGPFVLGDKVLWTRNDSVFWVVTADGNTTAVKLLPPSSVQLYDGSIAVLDDILYLLLDNGANLWRTDGTPGGTFKVLDAPPTSVFYSLRATADSLFWVQRFTVPNMSQQYLWTSDGTAAGTANWGEISDQGSTIFLLEVNGRLAFSTYQLTPPVRTLHVRDFPELDFPEQLYNEFAGLEVIDDQVFVLGAPVYNGLDVLHGLWVFRDGQLNLLAEFGSVGDYNIYSLAQLDRLNGLDSGVVFPAGPDATDMELWRSDGTVAGTFQVKDLNPAGSSKPENFLRYSAQQWLFTAFDGNATAWWVTDGTAIGTFKVADVLPAMPPLENLEIPNVSNAFLHQNRLFFSMNDGVTGQEPWVLELPDSLSVHVLIPFAKGPDFTLWPNPASDAINLVFEGMDGHELQATLFRIDGQVVLREKITPLGGAPVTLNFGDALPAGCYVLQVTDANGRSAVRRFMVEN